MQAASCFTSAELRFLAEDVPTSVIPNFNGRKGGDVTLLQGKINAFNATEALMVPFWMGLHLKRQGKCTFSVSTLDRKGHSLEWLKESRLSSAVQQEKHLDPPQRLEFHAIETAELMCRYAREDMLNWHSTNDLLVSHLSHFVFLVFDAGLV
jgi:Cu/Zn superoxide dismutase